MTAAHLGSVGLKVGLGATLFSSAVSRRSTWIASDIIICLIFLVYSLLDFVLYVVFFAVLATLNVSITRRGRKRTSRSTTRVVVGPNNGVRIIPNRTVLEGDLHEQEVQ